MSKPRIKLFEQKQVRAGVRRCYCFWHYALS